MSLSPDLIRGKINHLAIYPVKSGGRYDIPHGRITRSGLETISGIKDHGLAVVRAKANADGLHEVVTQRDKRDSSDRTERPQSFSELALIKPSEKSGQLQLFWGSLGVEGVGIPSRADQPGDTPIQVWEHRGNAIEIPEGSEWLSDHLEFDVKLVEMGSDWNRLARQNYMQNTNDGRFWDGYPIHFVNSRSVEELSQRAGFDVPWQDFRPQIVADFGIPNVEHQIHSGRVGSVEFVCPKPCDRCSITGVNSETGQLKVFKPLTELAKYRLWLNQDGDPKTIMGENLLPLNEASVFQGDIITATDLRNPALVFGSRQEIMRK